LPNRPPIVLASASPRRQELLRNVGIEFVVRPADIEEVPFAGEAPLAFAERMAHEKAIAASSVSFDQVVLAADTVVAVRDHILGKPVDTDHAAAMLRLLSGKTHSVITGICLLGKDFEDVRSETTAVQFATMSEDEIQEYVGSGEPLDKAGAYAIQGRASRWISKIDGDYYNVVGLPLDLVGRMLREHNVI
jgi:septum formation protein